MLTPCVYKRGLIWLLFFVISFFAVHFVGEAEPQEPYSTQHQEQKQPDGSKR